MIYLDNAATTFPKPDEVYAELDQANRNAFNTGRGSYKCAREASAIKEKVRQEILDLNRMNNGNVIYTSSATEALNDIIFGIPARNIFSYSSIYICPMVNPDGVDLVNGDVSKDSIIFSKNCRNKKTYISFENNKEIIRKKGRYCFICCWRWT